MFRAILIKEWIKLRGFFIGIFAFWILVLGYFAYTLDYSFATIEPQSMAWYRFVHLDDKPYANLLYALLVMAAFLSLVQFITERIRNRMRILTHLPLPFWQILLMHFTIGFLFLLISYLVALCVVCALFLHYYPVPLVYTLLTDFSLYLLLALLIYWGISSLIIEKSRTKGIGKFAITILIVALTLKPETLKEFTRFYIFYSPLLSDFVYQENHGDHRFNYYSKSGESFDQKGFEEKLPFVYWRDLEIQGRLPVVINAMEFGRDELKESRLSLEYEPSFLENSKIMFQPFFNPKSAQGMILFPEEALYFASNAPRIYDFDHGFLVEKSENLGKLLSQNGVRFPIQKLFGKPTNIKPFDLGYIIIDNENNLFNLRQSDDKITIKELESLKNLNTDFIYISENRAKEFAGYLITRDSSLYLLRWDFTPIKLELDGFKHHKMRLQILSDPLGFLVRFDDGNRYFGFYFDKNFRLVNKIAL